MANAKLRRKAREGLRELQARELGLVSGGRSWGTGGGYFDVNGSDWHRNHRHGRLTVVTHPNRFWRGFFG